MARALAERYRLDRELGAGGMATAENLGYYVRVLPNWVATMKRAVDEANE